MSSNAPPKQLPSTIGNRLSSLLSLADDAALDDGVVVVSIFVVELALVAFVTVGVVFVAVVVVVVVRQRLPCAMHEQVPKEAGLLLILQFGLLAKSKQFASGNAS